MTAPMNGVLIDGYINYILNILFDELIVKLSVFLEYVFKRTVDFKVLLAF